MIDFNIKDYMRSILSNGNYDFKIISCEIKPTKNNPDCRYVAITCEVISDFRKGGRFFDNFNIYNTNEAAQNIGRAKFAELCDAINLSEIKNINEMIGGKGNVILSEGSYIDKDGKKRYKNNVDKYSKIIGEKSYEIKSDEIPFDDDISF